MTEFSQIHRTSWFRICILVVLLVGWTAGVTLTISYLSPLDDLVRTVPMEPNVENRETLDRLSLQAEAATNLAKTATELQLAYSSTARKILKNLKKSRDLNTLRQLDKPTKISLLLKTVNDTAFNSDITVATNQRYNSSYKILDFSPQFTNSASDNNDYRNVKNIYISVWSPKIVLGTNQDDPKVVNLSTITSQSKLDEYFPFIQNSRPNAGSIFGVNDDVLTTADEYDRAQAMTAYQEWSLDFSPSKGPDIIQSLNNAIDQISTNLNAQEARLIREKEGYEKLATDMNERRKEMEGRMTSSDALFYVAASRAFLVTIVVVSIGFVLLRAFAAELTQTRRLRYLELSSILINNHDTEKLHYIADIIRSVGGEKSGEPSSSDGALPDAATVAEKLGNAVTKFTAASKGL